MISEFAALLGANFVVSEALTKYSDPYQFRFPRSKRKRIRKKWSKDSRNFKRNHIPQIYRMGHQIICDPISYFQLLEKIHANRV